MSSKFGTLQQKIQQHRVGIIVTIAIIVIAIVLIIIGHLLDWTGFNGYTQVSTIRTLSGPTAGTVTRTEVYLPGKTLWDWMQLLFIPVVLAGAGFWFNHRERRAAELRAENERKAAELRAEAERDIEQQRSKAEQEIASDNQREAALQGYINEMSELLLHQKLRESAPENEVRKIARVRTLTVLPRLDGKRKRNLLLFLYDADLIDRGNQIINVSDADLSEADLSGASLYRFKWIRDKSHKREGVKMVSADLSGVNLRNANLNGAKLGDVKLGAESDNDDVDDDDITLSISLEIAVKGQSAEGTILANLSGAKLVGADLSRAVLCGVDLSGADLSGANLEGAYLQRANLSGANLHGADLSIEMFIQPTDDPEEVSTWPGTNLSGADLSGANLSGADLLQANLSGANLSGADLSGANLRGANLTRARLTGITGITLEELKKQAKSLKGATMPNGLKHS